MAASETNTYRLSDRNDGSWGNAGETDARDVREVRS